ncbi:MAG TPA: cyclic nucleotide-binding domain-containing protein [Terriglobales bacterium]|nr:cyclic nucleotide-binding domain-containing protein [Terriglobales bacterium]
MSQSCFDCTQRSDRVFCDLAPTALAAFDGIKSTQMLPKGTVLFREGQVSRGVFLLCEGRVRLTVCSENGRRLTLRTVTAGELLGLSACLAGGGYEVTAEAVDNLRVAAVSRRDLLRFLREHREACLHVVNLLSEDLHVAYDRVRSVGLGRVRRARVS